MEGETADDDLGVNDGGKYGSNMGAWIREGVRVLEDGGSGEAARGRRQREGKGLGFDRRKRKEGWRLFGFGAVVRQQRGWQGLKVLIDKGEMREGEGGCHLGVGTARIVMRLVMGKPRSLSDMLPSPLTATWQAPPPFSQGKSPLGGNFPTRPLATGAIANVPSESFINLIR
ncbi:hypothetical protein Syun_009960 [Stephania yunnanensis]|uniref:Uncharacterized protein n=1 Tax=Stephania yunnanensis TaxID=152371 RepID=A0AAP0KFJ1_9MAGN